MTAPATARLDATLEAYLADVLDAVEEHGGVTVLGAFLLGSAALGGFDPQRSDLDVVAVVDRSLDLGARTQLVDRLGGLGCPARRLELVLYVEGAQPPAFELNVNTDATGAVERPDEPDHWFVIDAAIGEEHAVPFGDGERWQRFFAPVPPERLREALRDSIAWSERQPKNDEFARLNAIRARHYLEHAEWLSKQEAER